MKKKVLIILVAIFLIMIYFSIVNSIQAITIAIDAGHGGRDIGARALSKKIYEKDVNFKIAQYLKKYLEEYENVKIIMTRNDDSYIEIYDRAMIARKNKVDLLVSIHQNSSTATNLQGAEVYVTANKSLNKYNKEMTKLGNTVLSKLNKIGIKNRGVKTTITTNDDTDIYSDGTMSDYYGIIRYAMRGTKIDSGVVKPKGAKSAIVEKGEGIPVILIEHCYINSSDIQFIDSEPDMQKVARADADAIVEYYNLKKADDGKRNFKIQNNNIIAEPDITIKNIQEKYPNAKAKTQEQKLYTGALIDIEGKEYKLIELGDCNGDSSITPADYVKIKNTIMKVTMLKNEYKLAGDVNEDASITPADYVKVKNHIMKTSRIKIK